MRLLVYKSAYERLGAQFPAGVEPVIMDETGAMTLEGRPVTIDEAACEAAWTSGDLWTSPVARDFAIAILKSSGLKWMQSSAAGFDHPMFGQLVSRGVRLTTSHGQTVGIADFVLWGVLDHLQRGPGRRAAQEAHDWKRYRFREIEGQHWLVIGFGAIGSGVGRRARAFGAKVTGVRRNQAPHADADAIASLSDLPRLLPDADVVALCAPLTPETRHVANAAFFAAMRPRSVLVNVGRGDLVDEAALLAALAQGAPEHAVLDVFATEPLPKDNPFWDHPQVSVVAHASGNGEGRDARNDVTFLENLRLYLAGAPLREEARPADVITSPV
jgi:phosphoglycerate dehydrogenase-like enzyme